MDIPKRLCCDSYISTKHHLDCEAAKVTYFKLGDKEHPANGWLARNADRVFVWAISKGWEPASQRTFGDEIALIHSEVSEALEAYRQWGFNDATAPPTVSEEVNAKLAPPKPEGVASEFADILIRLLHYSAVHSIDLEREFERKMQYNETRAWRHGKKFM